MVPSTMACLSRLLAEALEAFLKRGMAKPMQAFVKNSDSWSLSQIPHRSFDARFDRRQCCESLYFCFHKCKYKLPIFLQQSGQSSRAFRLGISRQRTIFQKLPGPAPATQDSSRVWTTSSLTFRDVIQRVLLRFKFRQRETNFHVRPPTITVLQLSVFRSPAGYPDLNMRSLCGLLLAAVPLLALNTPHFEVEEAAPYHGCMRR